MVLTLLAHSLLGCYQRQIFRAGEAKHGRVVATVRVSGARPHCRHHAVLPRQAAGPHAAPPPVLGIAVAVIRVHRRELPHRRIQRIPGVHPPPAQHRGEHGVLRHLRHHVLGHHLLPHRAYAGVRARRQASKGRTRLHLHGVGHIPAAHHRQPVHRLAVLPR